MTDCSGCHNLRLHQADAGYTFCEAGYEVHPTVDGGYATNGVCLHRKLSSEVLQDKLDALSDVAHLCGTGLLMQIACEGRMASGHRKLGDDVASLDTRTEACEELLDFINYAALARMQGRWSWRWRLAGWLVGIAWRVLR
jgi:hypothetical protein